MQQPRQVQPGHMDKQRPVQRRTSFPTIELSVIVLLGIVLQIIVGLGSYSGRGRSPMHGDYEAQRHWMEITHHLPIKEWSD